MKSLRGRLSYANVISTIALVLALGGASAFAATKMAKNSVGTEQLKKDAVTAAKIKAGAVAAGEIAGGAVGADELRSGAVTGAKIGTGAVGGDKLADGAVTRGKLANGSITADKLAPALPFAGIVQRVRGTAAVAFPPTKLSPPPPNPYPLDNPAFTQPAGEDDLYVGSISARFPANCKAPRIFEAQLRIDAGAGLSATENIGTASLFDESEGEATRTAQFGANLRAAAFTAALASPTPHKFSVLLIKSGCGAGSDPAAVATATGAQIDVIGVR